mmetsp:Transcript_55701/g.180851  ORF Transcript_55701/g.180851 Transcript_55701/m.180851 type:complete len:248 (+) Transcript_55701:2997-3740(+)
MSSIIFFAYSTHSGGPERWTRRSSGLPSFAGSLEMSIRAPLSFFNSRTVSPPLPINRPMSSCGTRTMFAFGLLAPLRSRALPRVSSMSCLALSMLSREPPRKTCVVVPSASFWISMRAPLSLEICFTVSPPLPMSSPMSSCSMVIDASGGFGRPEPAPGRCRARGKASFGCAPTAASCRAAQPPSDPGGGGGGTLTGMPGKAPPKMEGGRGPPKGAEPGNAGGIHPKPGCGVKPDRIPGGNMPGGSS